MDKDEANAITSFLTRDVYPPGMTASDKRGFRKKCKTFVCHPDGCLFHCSKDGKERLVITEETQKQDLLLYAHTENIAQRGGLHNGENTTYQKIKNKYWWRHVFEDVKNFCKSCESCASGKTRDSRAPVFGIHSKEMLSDADNLNFEDSLTTLDTVARTVSTVNTRSAILCNDDHPRNVLAAMHDLWMQGALCDIVLAADTFRTSAHKAVLVASSSYLKSLLLDPDLPINDLISFQNVDGPCLEAIISFLYSGRLAIRSDNADKMLSVATALGISSAITLCNQFIEHPFENTIRDTAQDNQGVIDNTVCEEAEDTSYSSPVQHSHEFDLKPNIDDLTKACNRSSRRKRKKSFKQSSFDTNEISRTSVPRKTRSSHVRLRTLPSASKLAKNVLSTLSDGDPVKIEKSKLKDACPPRRIRCGWCGVTFSQHEQLMEHRKLVHAKTKPPANEISKTATSIEQPEDIKQLPRKDWNCHEESCVGLKITTQEKLAQHMKDIHPTVFFSCMRPRCSFKTQLERLFTRHMAMHNGRHVCQFCGNAYHKPWLLRAHMHSRHRQNDPLLPIFHCKHPGCQYSSHRKYAVSVHMVKHSQEREMFVCSSCGKAFKRELVLTKHISKFHSDIKPFICDKCGMGYSDENDLKIHVTRHAANKPYSCQQCSYSSVWKNSLKVHLLSQHKMLFDEDMNVLRCDQCTFSTTSPSNMDDHLRMHRNICDLPCSECSKLFITKGAMRAHVRRNHRPLRTPIVNVINCVDCEFTTDRPSCLVEHRQLEHSLVLA